MCMCALKHISWPDGNHCFCQNTVVSKTGNLALATTVMISFDRISMDELTVCSCARANVGYYYNQLRRSE